VGSRSDELNECFEFAYIPAAIVPGVYLASKRNEYQNRKNNDSGA
jgi:hypothetical protein